MQRKTAIGLLAQLVVVWALIFLGWGLDDLPGFFAHPARAGLLAVALAGVLYVAGSRMDVDPFRRGRQGSRNQRWAMLGVLGLLLLLAWFLPYADRRGILVLADADAGRYTGLALHVVGASIRLAALRTLGRQFSGYVTLQENHQLVQTGIYGRIRHPMYLGGLLGLPGMALVFRSWLAIPVLLLGVVFFAVRIRREERLLGEHFGAEFDAYQRRTWRLVPYLY